MDVIEAAEARVRTLDPAAVLAEWRDGRARLLSVCAGLDPGARIAWYGPAMGTRSFMTARLMETWAHGNDVADAVGAAYPATPRLRHVAHLGVATRSWSYLVHGREVPADPVWVDLDPPGGGEHWTWGDEAAADRVHGSALDFCLVVTQRRHVDQTALVVEGDRAREWMAIAQAFAGPPTATDDARRSRPD
jgi:uncharacterized protein (TIGR03084 family)